MEVSSPFVSHYMEDEIDSYWDLSEDIMDVLAHDEVKSVTAYSVYHVDRVLECLSMYCGGGPGGSSGGEPRIRATQTLIRNMISKMF